MDVDGVSYNEEQIQQIVDAGYAVELTLSTDGKASLTMMDQSYNGTWSPTSDTKATATLDGDRMTLTLTNGGSNLVMAEGSNNVVFYRQ